MEPSLLDELETFIRTRMEAATRDKALYERNGARLNAQLLQGEINMGTAVLDWLSRRRAGATAEQAAEAEEGETAEG
jgi:hypothetical protein